jgi:hypothetical protein
MRHRRFIRSYGVQYQIRTQNKRIAQENQLHPLNLQRLRDMAFKNINEALKYIAVQAKAYPTEMEYYSSEEYKKIYPDLCRVNRLLQEAYNVHHEDGS